MALLLYVITPAHGIHLVIWTTDTTKHHNEIGHISNVIENKRDSTTLELVTDSVPCFKFNLTVYYFSVTQF